MAAEHLEPGLTLVEETDGWSTQILTGPAARAILSEVTKADLTKPWLTWQWATIGGAEVLLMRVSFAGELGWEIHSRTADTPAVWDIVMRAGRGHGLRPFGMFALNSLRIEKGYRAWKGDLSTDYTILQGGLERFVDWTKDEFPAWPDGLDCSVPDFAVHHLREHLHPAPVAVHELRGPIFVPAVR